MADLNINENAHGEGYMVMLLEAEWDNSIEFKCVRHALFLDAPETFQRQETALWDSVVKALDSRKNGGICGCKSRQMTSLRDPRNTGSK